MRSAFWQKVVSAVQQVVTEGVVLPDGTPVALFLLHSATLPVHSKPVFTILAHWDGQWAEAVVKVFFSGLRLYKGANPYFSISIYDCCFSTLPATKEATKPEKWQSAIAECIVEMEGLRQHVITVAKEALRAWGLPQPTSLVAYPPNAAPPPEFVFDMPVYPKMWTVVCSYPTPLTILIGVPYPLPTRLTVSDLKVAGIYESQSWDTIMSSWYLYQTLRECKS